MSGPHACETLEEATSSMNSENESEDATWMQWINQDPTVFAVGSGFHDYVRPHALLGGYTLTNHSPKSPRSFMLDLRLQGMTPYSTRFLVVDHTRFLRFRLRLTPQLKATIARPATTAVDL
jgi:hypothetical protein